MDFSKVIEDIETAFAELKESAKIVFDKMHGTQYKGNYCYPFYRTGCYYYEGRTSYSPEVHYRFIPDTIDSDMRRFIDALRILDDKVRPMFTWNIRTGKEWGDEGNLKFEEVNGWCYQGHGVNTNECRHHAAVVSAIIRGVYKDAFLEELIQSAKEKGSPLNKNDFMEIQAFSR